MLDVSVGIKRIVFNQKPRQLQLMSNNSNHSFVDIFFIDPIFYLRDELIYILLEAVLLIRALEGLVLNPEFLLLVG